MFIVDSLPTLRPLDRKGPRLTNPIIEFTYLWRANRSCNSHN